MLDHAKSNLWRPRCRAAFALLGLAIAGGTAHAASQIQLLGNVSRKCTLDATPDPAAANLALTLAGPQRVAIGTVAQDCNGNVDFLMQVFSANCASAPPGAKLVDPVSSEYLHYTVESENPATGGSATLVTGLLDTGCANQVAREVIHGHVRNETSTLYVYYTGSSILSAGTYQDIITLTLTVN